MDTAALRIIDANLNRAREALRVLEDYARFALNDDALCARLKHLRHDFQRATQSIAAVAIVHRDTAGDVGTRISTASEQQRKDQAHVVTAAAKRLAEALRTIEEYSKTVDPAVAESIEAMRYESYDIELRLAQTFCPPSLDHVRLYVLVSESLCREPWMRVVEEVISGGAECVQLREKNLTDAEHLHRAKEFVRLCRSHDVISIVNDRPDIAALSGAAGVHVGQEDLAVREVRKIVGNRMLIGVSTHSLEQARQAMLDGADYIGVGPVFRSQTKPREILPGLEYARAAAAAVKIPCVAIAGITCENVEQVIATGVKAVAVSSAIVSSDDPRAVTERFRRLLSKHAVGQTCPSGGTIQ